ncbi:hypothetical protein QQX98_012736 [Neonectria punicea]|uniref:Major facilitator superfamily (MFS) profile domain-containing protein n=1 Tax=Neonectria punicea TaxID=979145 RepID=A0ABR1GI49_9HYPO
MSAPETKPAKEYMLEDAEDDGEPAATKAMNEVLDIIGDIKGSRPSATSIHMFKLYLMLSVGYFCIILQGYDSSLMGAINAMPQYLKYYGLKSASSSTGLVFAMYNIGAVAALPFAGPINDSFGRRWGMFAGAFLVIGFLNVAGITFVTELAHPYYRGPLSSFLETNYFVGSIVASWVTYGTAYMAGDISFRLPDGSSPTIYHGEGSVGNPFVRLQLVEMRAQISTTGSDKRWWDYRELYNTSSARKRLICVVGFAWFGQYSGNALVSYYFPVIVQQTGISDAHTQLLLNALNPVVSWLAAIAGSMLSDRVGRRPLMLGGFLGCALCLAVVTGLSKESVETSSKAAGNAGIFFIYFFSVVFSFCLTPLQPFYISEVLTMETRAKGNAVGQIVASIAGIVGQYSTGVAIEYIGYYYYLVFIFWDCFEVIIVYFFFPETKGRTLEEINEIFDDPHPVKKSLERRS